MHAVPKLLLQHSQRRGHTRTRVPDPICCLPRRLTSISVPGEVKSHAASASAESSTTHSSSLHASLAPAWSIPRLRGPLSAPMTARSSPTRRRRGRSPEQNHAQHGEIAPQSAAQHDAYRPHAAPSAGVYCSTPLLSCRKCRCMHEHENEHQHEHEHVHEHERGGGRCLPRSPPRGARYVLSRARKGGAPSPGGG